MENLKVLELFGGIGACSNALKRLNIPFEIVDYVEIDKYAVKSFNAIYGTNFEPQDITNWDKDIEVDLIMHGSPCQDFSLAGKQAGGDEGSGTRSSLMYETLRIVEKLRPRYVIWENVKNILSNKHIHNFNAYLDKMEQLGYTNYYQVLNAKDYGIPQNRERVFTVSILGNDSFEFPKENKNDNNIKRLFNFSNRHDCRVVYDSGGLAPTLVAGMGEGGGKVPMFIENESFEFPPKQELKLKLKDMLEDEVDEKYYLSDEITNRIKYKFNNENDILGGMQEHQSIKKDGICTTLTSSMGMGGGYVPMVSRKYGVFDTEKTTHQAGSVYDDNYLSPTLDTMQGGWRQPCIEVKNNLTYSPYVNKKYDNFIDKNGYIPEMFNPYNEKEITDISPTLTAQGDSITKSSTVLKNDGLRIRKLTPKECWRLMGFDDEDFEKAEQVNSDTQLYKQAGNSIVVNVLVEIFKNLFDKEGEIK